MKKTLSKLKPLHPLPDDLDEIKEYGFKFDIGVGSKWITDGNAIFYRSDFDDNLLVNAMAYVGQKPKIERIANLWSDAETREDIPVSILGCLDRIDPKLDLDEDDEETRSFQLAILRDEQDRIIYADAFKLAFMLYAHKPEELSVAEDGGEMKWISFYRGGKLVGCLMPMQKSLHVVSGNPEDGYDIDGDPLPLAIEVVP